jgi:hypothetical protein
MPEDYQVSQGDCIGSIAYDRGFFWETIWNHADNADLKSRRQDPSVLMEGDVVHIPDLTIKEVSAADKARHKFRRKGVPAKAKIRVCIDDEPQANKPYLFYVDDVLISQGNTDGDGCVSASIPPNAQKGKLDVGSGDDRDVIVLQFGAVDPLDTDEGVASRLRNMGYDVSDLAQALAAFQEKEHLDVTGSTDDATRSRLRERFGH